MRRLSGFVFTVAICLPLAASAEALVSINGQTLTTQDLKAYRQHLGKDADLQSGVEANCSVLLEKLINRRLLLEAAKKRELAKKAEVQHALRQSRQRTLIRSLLDRVAAKRVSAQRIKSYYRSHFAEGEQALQVRLIRRSAPTYQRANELREKLEACDQAGTWIFPSLQAPTLDKALQEGQRGQIVGPIAIDGGWVLARITGQRQVAPPTLESIQNQIRKRLEAEAIRAFLSQLREQANIVYNDPLSSAE